MPHRAIFYPIASTLALVTAVALLRAAAVVDDHGGGDASPSDTRAVVRTFYDAVNAAISSGDVAALDAVVDPNLVTDSPAPGLPPTGAGLARYVGALHASMPNVRLVVDDVIVVADRALARVTVRGTDHGTFLGLALAERSVIWGAVDVFRVADHRIVELIANADRPLLPESLHRLSLAAQFPTRPTIALERWSFVPHARFEAPREQITRVFYVTAGAVTVTIAAESPETAWPTLVQQGEARSQSGAVTAGTEARVTAGSAVSFPAASRYALRNDGPGRAEALVLTPSTVGTTGNRTPPSSAPQSAPAPAAHSASGTDAAAGVDADPSPTTNPTVQLLAGGWTAALPSGPLVAASGRVTLAPAAALTLPDLTGTVLLTVETGTLGLDAGDGMAWVQRGATGTSQNLAATTLAPGDGGMIAVGGDLILRNLGHKPAAVLLFTLASEQSGA